MPRILVIASRAANLGSVAIRAAQFGRAWSHTADVFVAGGYHWTAEALASRGGVVQSSVEDLQRRSSEWIALGKEVSADAAAKRDQWLTAQIGKGYDYTGAVGAAWWQWRKMDDPQRWWCSELTACAAAVAGMPLSPYIKGVMPTQCVDLLIAAGWEPVSIRAHR